jgi:aryl-alcohol dehydrogenase-like predicted oxidoreductase
MTTQPRELPYALLGSSGLRVSALCLGTMTFGEEWGWGADKATSRAIFTRFVEHGCNFIDTANNYTKGTSESWLGEFIRGNRDRFVIGTKYSLSTRADDPNAGGNHRKNLVRSLEASLRRLRTDYVDLYWLHVWDSLTPVDEVLRALDDVVRAGKVLYVGISDVPAWIVSYANGVAEFRGWSSFIGLRPNTTSCAVMYTRARGTSPTRKHELTRQRVCGTQGGALSLRRGASRWPARTRSI